MLIQHMLIQHMLIQHMLIQHMLIQHMLRDCTTWALKPSQADSLVNEASADWPAVARVYFTQYHLHVQLLEVCALSLCMCVCMCVYLCVYVCVPVLANTVTSTDIHGVSISGCRVRRVPGGGTQGGYTHRRDPLLCRRVG